jgi:hypothetical protein
LAIPLQAIKRILQKIRASGGGGKAIGMPLLDWLAYNFTISNNIINLRVFILTAQQLEKQF